jgi:sigma-E factor negative regulatory protein RseB
MACKGFLSRASVLGIVLSLSLPALADDEAVVAEVRGWLDRMARAVETLNYRGSLVHWRDGQVDSLRIIHRADERGIRERIYSLDGEAREILRDGDQVRSLLAGDQPLVVQSQLTARLMPNLPVSRLASPESAYRMSMGERERVAGMMTRIIEILPSDEFRYGYRLWLEEQTGMLLRSALLDHRGRQLQQLSFVDIELGVPISDVELEPELDQRLAQLATLPDRLPPGAVSERHRASWAPSRLPDNFRLVKVGRGNSQDGSGFEHLLYSDGLASFSIYIEEGQGLQGYGGGRLESMGPVHVYTGMVDGRQITVVGEVPQATVEFVGRALRRSPGPRRR